MIRCVAIDDEPIALTIIEKYCEQFGDIDLRCFDSPVDGINYVIENPPHILFLDIEMQPLNGLDLAKRIPKEVCLIFTTAYRQFALEGFELNAVDYIQKPILYDRFERAINKAKHWLKIDDQTLTLNAERQRIRIMISDILYVEAMDNYVKIHRESQQVLTFLMSMKDCQELLPSDRFIRVHRSYLVSIGKIESIGTKGVTIFDGKTIIPIGRTYWKACQKLFK